MGRPCTRRAALTGLFASVAAIPLRAAPTAMPAAPILVVAGPGDGTSGHWASLLAAALGRSLQLDAPLSLDNVGGADGVTAANQFEARGPVDGGTALLLPGEAALAGLVGESRAQFEVGRWVPLWGANSQAALLSRSKPTPGRRLRLAVGSVGGPDLAALLALDLLGVDTVPVPFDPNHPNELPIEADAYFLRGAAMRDAIPRVGPAAFTLGALDPAGTLQRDPALPDVPTAQELVLSTGRASPDRLLAAFRAVCASVSLAECLVLPLLAPAAVVAWWRQGCLGLDSDAAIQDEARRSLQLPMPTGAIAASLAAVNVGAPVLIELRRWLADRHHWRAG